MDFPINAKAEGRVLVPWEHRSYPNLTVQNSSGEDIPCYAPGFLLPSSKLASKPCLTAHSALTGLMTVPFGTPGDAHVILQPRHDAFSPLFATFPRSHLQIPISPSPDQALPTHLTPILSLPPPIDFLYPAPRTLYTAPLFL